MLRNILLRLPILILLIATTTSLSGETQVVVHHYKVNGATVTEIDLIEVPDVQPNLPRGDPVPHSERLDRNYPIRIAPERPDGIRMRGGIHSAAPEKPSLEGKGLGKLRRE